MPPEREEARCDHLGISVAYLTRVLKYLCYTRSNLDSTMTLQVKNKYVKFLALYIYQLLTPLQMMKA